jgi:hypothetical protein
MRRIALAFVAAWLLAAAAHAVAIGGGSPAWPTLDKQLTQARAVPGTALEKLIRQNQDFSILRPAEASDTLPVPLWLRVYWRKGHPEGTYSGDDPTGGYPLVLKEIYEWMSTHQSLVASPLEPERPIWEKEEAGGGPSSIFEATTVGADSRISGATTNPRSESSITIDFLNPNRILAASNNIVGSGRQVMMFSGDGGATWGQSFLPFTSTDSFHSDPTGDWTSNGNAWSATIGIKGNTLKMRSYRSTDGGATWTFDATFSANQRATDKEMLWIDHSATSAFRDTVHVCWHNNAPAFVNHRTGPGGAWLASPIQVSGAESTGTAIGCDIKTNSAGDTFVFWPTTGNARIIERKSTNGGNAWAAAKIVATTFDTFDIGVPSFASRRALIYVAGGAYKTATTDNVYATWTDLTGATGCTAPANEPGTNVASTCKTRIWFARSTDGGTTWGAKTMINNQASLNDQFNQWLAVDETNGRIAVMYYDTVADAGRKKTNVYYQTSADDGTTWSAAVKVTSAATDETIAGADSGNQYGDYNGLSGFMSKFFPSWTDRRNNAKEEIWTVPISEP